MTETLDQFGPTQEMLMGIRQQLLRAGIIDEDIPYSWMPAIIAATQKWLMTSDDGLEHFSRLLGFKVRPSDDDKEYTVVLNSTRESYKVENSRVKFFEGALIDGKPIEILDIRRKEPIPALELEISEKAKNHCEGCGIVSHCLKEVRDPFAGKLVCLCNYCLTYHEHPRVSELGGYDICKTCTVLRCQHHPSHVKLLSDGRK